VLGLTLAGEIASGGPISSDGRESAVHALPIEKVGIGNRTVLKVGYLLEHGDDLIGVTVRQRVEEDTANNREDGCVGADAKRKRQNCDGGERGRLHQHTDAVLQVLQKGFEGRTFSNGRLVHSHLVAQLACRPVLHDQLPTRQ
jgi:hypothetical protein